MPIKLGVALITYNRRHLAVRTAERLKAMTNGESLIVACDDGSSDGTVSALQECGIKVIGKENKGVCWNKNRALFFTLFVEACDVVIMIEDDAFPTEPGWEIPWKEGALRYGHMNLAGSWFKDQFVSGNGNVSDPVKSKSLSGQCASFSREAVAYSGFLNTEFRGYGYGHAEHSERLILNGFGGEFADIEGMRRPLFYMLKSPIQVEAKESFKNADDLKRNSKVYETFRNTSTYCPPWSNEEEKSFFRGEIDAARRL